MPVTTISHSDGSKTLISQEPNSDYYIVDVLADGTQIQRGQIGYAVPQQSVIDEFARGDDLDITTNESESTPTVDTGGNGTSVNPQELQGDDSISTPDPLPQAGIDSDNGATESPQPEPDPNLLPKPDPRQDPPPPGDPMPDPNYQSESQPELQAEPESNFQAIPEYQSEQSAGPQAEPYPAPEIQGGEEGSAAERGSVDTTTDEGGGESGN